MDCGNCFFNQEELKDRMCDKCTFNQKPTGEIETESIR